MAAIMIIVILLVMNIVSTRYVYVAQSTTKENIARLGSVLSAVLLVFFLVLGFHNYANSTRLPERRNSLEVRKVNMMRKISRSSNEVSIKIPDIPEFVQLIAEMKEFNRDLRRSQAESKGIFSLFIPDSNVNLKPLKLFN